MLETAPLVAIDRTPLRPWLPPSDSGRDRILDAFEQAIVLHGVQAASFARIAQEGGFHRSLIQHHFQTREHLVKACVTRVVDVYLAKLSWLTHLDPPEACASRLTRLQAWLLAPYGEAGPPREARVVDAFVALATQEPHVREELARLYQGFAEVMSDALAACHPEAPDALRDEVSWGLVALAFGRATFDTMGLGAARGAMAVRAAEALLDELRES